MRIVPPTEITSSRLTSSNVAITETEWVAGTYNTGVQRYVGTVLYEVVADPSTDDEPTAGAVKEPPTWIRVGAINRYKMFDFIIGARTVQVSGAIDVTVDLPTSLVNAVAFFEVQAASVQVIVTDSTEGEVYNRTISLNDNAGVSNWYAYFFSPIVQATSAVFADLPAYTGASIRTVVDADGETTAVGEMIVGRQKTLGVTLQDFSFGIEDFSRKERDAFGNFTIVERRFARLAEYDVFLNNAEVSPTFKALAAVRAEPTVYIGNAEMPETVVLGFYKDFSVLRTGPGSSEMTLEIEGLV